MRAKEEGQNLTTTWGAFQAETQPNSDFSQFTEVNGNKNLVLPFGIIHPDASEPSQKMAWEPIRKHEI